MPTRFLAAEWRYLLMLNYEIDADVLKPLVPQGTELDAWNGKTFVSMVGFRFQRTRVLGVPIPFHIDFDEINLRFYVRREADDGVRRGVVFIKEIVPRWAIASIARWVYNENYVACPMRSGVQIPIETNQNSGRAEYTWKSQSQWNRLAAKFGGAAVIPSPDSEEEFITEHYWGYVRQRDGSTVEYRVAHPQWPVWRASDAEFECAVEDFYGPQFAEALRQQPSSAFVAEGSAIEVYRGDNLNSKAGVEA